MRTVSTKSESGSPRGAANSDRVGLVQRRRTLRGRRRLWAARLAVPCPCQAMRRWAIAAPRPIPRRGGGGLLARCCGHRAGCRSDRGGPRPAAAPGLRSCTCSCGLGGGGGGAWAIGRRLGCRRAQAPLRRRRRVRCQVRPKILGAGSTTFGRGSANSRAFPATDLGSVRRWTKSGLSSTAELGSAWTGSWRCSTGLRQLAFL